MCRLRRKVSYGAQSTQYQTRSLTNVQRDSPTCPRHSGIVPGAPRTGACPCWTNTSPSPGASAPLRDGGLSATTCIWSPARPYRPSSRTQLTTWSGPTEKVSLLRLGSPSWSETGSVWRLPYGDLFGRKTALRSRCGFTSKLGISMGTTLATKPAARNPRNRKVLHLSFLLLLRRRKSHTISSHRGKSGLLSASLALRVCFQVSLPTYISHLWMRSPRYVDTSHRLRGLPDLRGVTVR